MSSSTHELNRSSSKRPVGQRGLQAGRTARSLCALHERITGRVPDVQRRSRPPARAGLGAARARATCVRATCAVRGCVWIFQRFGFSSARAHGACSLCYLTRALIRLRPRTVTARDGTMPRTCGRGSSRAPEPSVPVRSGSGPATLYIYTSPRIPPRRLLSKRARLTSHKRALGHTHAVRHHWQSGPRERSRGEAASHPS